jgi:hypothetical protein|tara:strand:- start:1200 stop:1442 length:243 start_codon:yes stop_codon:yes gene_type:complete
MTEEQFNKIMSSPDHLKVSEQKNFEMELENCLHYQLGQQYPGIAEGRKICKSLRTDKNLCDDCWEGAMDALAPWNQEEHE